MPKNWKKWFEGSPAVLIVGAVAASLTFAIDVAEKVWRLQKEITAPEPPRASIRIERQGVAMTILPTPELLKNASVQGTLELQMGFAKLLKDPGPITPQTLRYLTVRPVHVLVLNPTKEPLTVHTCRIIVNRGSLFTIRSIGYFLGQDVFKVRADEINPLIAVNPGGVRQEEALFVFPHVPRLQLLSFAPKEELKNGTAKDAPASAELELQCEDQAGRPLTAPVVRGVAERPKPTPIPRPGR